MQFNIDIHFRLRTLSSNPNQWRAPSWPSTCMSSRTNAIKCNNCTIICMTMRPLVTDKHQPVMIHVQVLSRPYKYLMCFVNNSHRPDPNTAYNYIDRKLD